MHIRPVLNYRREARVTTKGDDKERIKFKREMIRKMYGPYHLYTNKRTLVKSIPNVVSFVKSQRITMTRACLDGRTKRKKLNGKKPSGRPDKDRLLKDLQTIDETIRVEDADDSERRRGV